MSVSPAARHALADRSFERLYRRHRRDVYGFALRAVRDPDDAEDVTQVAFLNAYRALHRGDEPEKPRAWLLTIANNVARRQFRERALRPHEVELNGELPANGSEWGVIVAREIRAALARLRPTRRAVVVLRDIEGLSYAEIAERLGLSQSAVESLLFRARKDLQKELTDLGRTPVVRRRRLRGLLVLPLPASLLSSLDSVVIGLSRTPVAVRAAGAVAALALGAGVATQGGSIVSAAIGDGKHPAAVVSAAEATAIPDERIHTDLTTAAAAAPQPGAAAKTTKKKAKAVETATAAAGDNATAGSETQPASSTSTVAPVELPVPAPALPDAAGTVDDVASALPLPPPPTLPLP
jgi:RNA polymerase sigma-70 factor (ECF subfamily)